MPQVLEAYQIWVWYMLRILSNILVAVESKKKFEINIHLQQWRWHWIQLEKQTAVQFESESEELRLLLAGENLHWNIWEARMLQKCTLCLSVQSSMLICKGGIEFYCTPYFTLPLYQYAHNNNTSTFMSQHHHSKLSLYHRQQLATFMFLSTANW